jgi:hypothetical protein
MLTRWSKDEIALEILRRFTANEPLSYGEMQKNDLRLLRAATRHFGSWKAAIEYAGLDYDQIRRYRVWTRERIIEEIQRLHAEGQDLSWRHVSTVLAPSLAAAATRRNRFGSWRKALEAAGLSYDEIRRHKSWEPEEILAELRRRYDAGLSLRVADVATENPSLLAAARRRFSGWYEAVVAAGIDELEARRGPDSQWDEETARGEMSWLAGSGKGG